MEFGQPTREDWVKIQGHVPYIKEKGGILYILHILSKDQYIVVPTDKKLFEEMGDIDLIVPGTNKRVTTKVAYLRSLHGAPCSIRSKNAGGKPYNSPF